MFRMNRIGMAVAALCAGTVPLFAQAQTQPQPASSTQQLQRVEVTGSNIKRTDTETASPITVITREDMIRSGASTLGDVITKLTVAQGGLSGVEFSGFTPGAATISLRGLGGGATLVLINGRRIAPYGITGFQEVLTSVNSIPVAAIDRIDILKDGASAIYGSEAIAGVVNIILRQDYRGLETTLNHSFNEGGAVNVTRFGLSGGVGDIAADRYNLFGVYEHLQQGGAIVSENKFFPSRNLVSLTGLANQDFRSSYSYPGNILNGTITPIPGTTCPPQNQRVVGGVTRCTLDTFDYNTMIPKATRDSLFARGNFQISGNLSAFAELGLSRSDYTYQFDPQFYYNTGAATLLTSGAPYGIAGDVELIYRAGDLGPRKYKVLSDELRLLVGLKGSMGGWDFDSAVGRMQGKVTVDQYGSILITPMEDALANGTYVPGYANSAAVIAGISPVLSRKGKATTTFADARVSTEFSGLTLPGGPVGFAAGIEARRETQKDEFDNRFVIGEVFGFGALEPIDASANVKSAYAEFNLPILKTLEAQLAARYDRYSVGGTSTTPKVGLKWTALPNLVLRGTMARGFRAANARETNTATSVGFYNGVQDPVRCPVIDPTQSGLQPEHPGQHLRQPQPRAREVQELHRRPGVRDRQGRQPVGRLLEDRAHQRDHQPGHQLPARQPGHVRRLHHARRHRLDHRRRSAVREPGGHDGQRHRPRPARQGERRKRQDHVRCGGDALQQVPDPAGARCRGRGLQRHVWSAEVPCQRAHGLRDRSVDHRGLVQPRRQLPEQADAVERVLGAGGTEPVLHDPAVEHGELLPRLQGLQEHRALAAGRQRARRGPAVRLPRRGQQPDARLEPAVSQCARSHIHAQTELQVLLTQGGGGVRALAAISGWRTTRLPSGFCFFRR